MSTRLAIAALVFMMVQAVLFGIGAIVILATPLQTRAVELFPAMIAISVALSLPLSWWLAPRLRARFWNTEKPLSAGDKVLADIS
jgi:hypothetical protein